MTLRRIALIAKERHPPGQLVGQIHDEFLLGPEIFPKLSKVSFEIAVPTQSMTQIARSTQRSFVAIDDTDGLECGSKRGLREAFASRDRELADVEQRPD